jgi:hypothetical protein
MIAASFFHGGELKGVTFYKPVFYHCYSLAGDKKNR